MLEERQAHAAFRIIVFSGHVHNYERHEHGGITYFVSGGGGAHAYPIQRMPDDPFQSKEVNYHYLSVEVGSQQVTITMNRVDLSTGNRSLDAAGFGEDFDSCRRSGASCRTLDPSSILAQSLAALLLPRDTERVQDQPVAERQRLRIQHGSIGVPHRRITSNTPLLVAHDSTTVFAGRLLVILIAVIPTGCGLNGHTAPPFRH